MTIPDERTNRRQCCHESATTLCERLIVTDRGRPVAQLTPLDPSTLDDRARIEQGIAQGWITPAKRRGGLGKALPVPSSSGMTIAEVFDEDRGD